MSAVKFEIDEVFIHLPTPAGHVVGKRRGTVSVFKGIPYAIPPVGALRWRPPQRAPRWKGAYQAFHLGPAPVQDLPPRSSLLYRLNNDDARALVMSEDCLYLNVWSPAPARGTNLPVMVWIHGGANKSGHGGQELFDGRRLAERGIVVVTVNMRLGALGFLSLPELAAEDPLGASGNYGLQDVVAALGWVQDNIASFGGEPARVTIAGNSVGAAAVTHLMAAPAARGLFRAAIGQSLSGIFRPERGMKSHEEAAELGRAAVTSLGCSIEQLRDLPPTAFLNIAPQGVVVDGRLLSEDTKDVFLTGRQARIPLLTGWNADEGSLYATPGAVEDLKLASFPERERDALRSIYPHAFDKEWHVDRRALVGDCRFAYPVWRWGRTHTETAQSAVWLYRFEHVLPVPADLPPPPDGGTEYGTFHTAELPYVWDNLAARKWAWREQDLEIAKRLADTWARFVIDGDPNGDGLPKWQPFDASQKEHLMELGAKTRPGTAARQEAFEIFDETHLRMKQ